MIMEDNKGNTYGECFSCSFYKKCKENVTMQCKHNPDVTMNDLIWRDDYSLNGVIFGEITYGDIVNAVKQEKVKDHSAISKVLKKMFDIRMQDLTYLVCLNADKIINDAK